MLLALPLFAACCDEAPRETTALPTSGPIAVAAVNYPLAYFAQRIGGDAIEPAHDLPAGVDPAHWRPTVDDIARFQASEVILDNGAGYAGWMATATLPMSRVVDTSDPFHTRLIAREGSVTHSHGPGGEHDHGELAFTTWLDLRQAVQQAAAVRDALVARRPDDRARFDAGFEALRRDLEQLDDECVAAVTPTMRRRAYFSHPVYDYLARRFGIEQRSVHWEPDVAPTAEQWAELDAHREAGFAATVMFWEGPPTAEAVAGLAERGIESLVYAPCGDAPETGDFLTVMRANRDALRAAYGAD